MATIAPPIDREKESFSSFYLYWKVNTEFQTHSFDRIYYLPRLDYFVGISSKTTRNFHSLVVGIYTSDQTDGGCNPSCFARYEWFDFLGSQCDSTGR